MLGKTPTSEQKERFYELVKDKIVQRTASGKDINYKTFASYTADYAAEKGVTRTSVDLIRTGDMLKSFEENSKQPNIVKIQIDESEVGKAHGNITGSYGKKSGNPSKARNFFGMKEDDPDLNKIVQQVKEMESLSNLGDLADAPKERSQPFDLVAARASMNNLLGDTEGFDGEG